MTNEAKLMAARERVALIAESRNEYKFAREVRVGCWDHRNDVQAALDGKRLSGETDEELQLRYHIPGVEGWRT